MNVLQLLMTPRQKPDFGFLTKIDIPILGVACLSYFQ